MRRLLARIKGTLYHSRDLYRRYTTAEDDQWQKWRRDLERIYSETLYVFENRYVFREVHEMFRTNRQLNTEGGFVYDWMKGMYGRDMVLAVGREVDRHTESINLIQIMNQMIARPRVVSRKRFFQMLDLKEPHGGWPGDMLAKHLRESNEKWFTNNIGAGHYLDPASIKRDRNWLQKRCRPVMQYRHKMVAHRSSIELTLTIEQIDAALDAIEEMFKKYYLLFYGGALMGAEPAIQWDWSKVFSIPWAPRERPEDEQ